MPGRSPVRLGRGRLDAEHVLAFLGGGDADGADRERDLLLRHAGEHEQPALPRLHGADIALGDLKDHAEGIERRHLEQHLALLDRRAEHLAEVAADHHPVEGCADARSRELVLDQFDLRARLGELGREDARVGAIVARQRVAVFAVRLLVLRTPLVQIQPQIALVEARQRVAGRDALAGAHRGAGDEAIEGRDDRALLLALDQGLAGHAVLAGREAQPQQQRQRQRAADAEAQPARIAATAPERAQRLAATPGDPAVQLVAQRQVRHQQRRHRLGCGHEGRVEGLRRQAAQRAEHAPAQRQHDRARGPLAGQIAVRHRDHPHRSGQRRMHHRAQLVAGFLHRVLERHRERGLAVEPRRVRERAQADPPAPLYPHRDALAAEARRARVRELHQRTLELRLLGHFDRHIERQPGTFLTGLARLERAAQQQGLDAPGAPVQPAPDRTQLGLAARREIEHDRAQQVTGLFQRIRRVQAARGFGDGVGHGMAGGERALRHRPEVGDVGLRIRPYRGRHEGTAVVTQQQQRGARAVDLRAQQAQPGATVGGGIGGIGQPLPQRIDAGTHTARRHGLRRHHCSHRDSAASAAVVHSSLP